MLGIVPDPSDPEWSGREVLRLVADAARDGVSSLILDLAPGHTDLAARFGAEGEPGFAELVAGEAELWEIVRRDDDRDAFYFPRGEIMPGEELAGSTPARVLGNRVRERGRLLVVLLDRGGAESVGAAGWTDGLVRLGGKSGRASPAAGDSVDLHHEDPRPGGGGDPEEAEAEADPARFRRRDRSRAGMPRLAVAVAAVVVLAAVGVLAMGILGDSGQRSSDSAAASALTGPRVEASAPGRPPPLPAGPVAEASTPATAGAALAHASSLSSSSAGGSSPATGGRSTSSTGASPLPSRPGDMAGFRAVSDSLARSLGEYYRLEREFREGRVGCPAVVRAHRRAGRLFVELSLARVSLGPRLDSTTLARFRDYSRRVQAMDRSFGRNACPSPADD